MSDSDTVRYPLYRGARFLGSRGPANSLRLLIEEAISENPDVVIELDCSQVDGASHGFIDELLTPLDELLGARVRDRVRFINCAPALAEAVSLVCRMHDLHEPEVLLSTERGAPGRAQPL